MVVKVDKNNLAEMKQLVEEINENIKTRVETMISLDTNVGGIITTISKDTRVNLKVCDETYDVVNIDFYGLGSTYVRDIYMDNVKFIVKKYIEDKLDSVVFYLGYVEIEIDFNDKL